MRVLFLQRQPCMRALKYAVGLRAAVDELRLDYAYQGATLSGFYGTGDELFDNWWPLGWEPTEPLRRVLDETRPDLIHVHNLPDDLTVLAQELTRGSVPVIHDVHDLQSLRQTPYEDGFPEPPGDLLELERRAVEGSDALLTVSQELVEEIGAQHRLPPQVMVFPSFVLGRDLPNGLPPVSPRPDGPLRVVYQGTVSSNGGHYDLRAIFASLVGEGLELHVFPNRPAPEYQRLAASLPGMHCHRPLSPAELLRRLPEFDFGWAGFNAGLNGAHLETVLPNKLFEYLGCGLPVLALRHRALTRFLETERLGICVPAIEGLSERLSALDVAALRGRVAAVRDQITVEANIGRVLELYREMTTTSSVLPGARAS